MSASHRIVIASPPDREGVVAEIWHGDEMWGEVANEEGRLTLEFYPKEPKGTWLFDYDEALNAIQTARSKLLGKE